MARPISIVRRAGSAYAAWLERVLTPITLVAYTIAASGAMMLLTGTSEITIAVIGMLAAALFVPTRIAQVAGTLSALTFVLWLAGHDLALLGAANPNIAVSLLAYLLAGWVLTIGRLELTTLAARADAKRAELERARRAT